MSTATNDNTNKKWKITANLGTITTSNVSKTLTISTKDTYVDKDIEIAISATKPSAAVLGASATGAATIDSVTVGTKASGAYPITGSADISGTASASTTTSGYATKDSTAATGSTTGTASLDASLPAAAALVSAPSASVTITNVSGSKAATKPTVAISAADDNVVASTATTTKPSTGYYAAVKATAPATTGISVSGSGTGNVTNGTITVGTKGYLGDKSEITLASGASKASASASGSASTTATTGDTYYVPIQSSSIGVKNKGATGLSDYAENTTAVVPSEGYLTIEEGYIPKTKISLATLVPNEANIGNTKGDDTILIGTIVYDADGVKHTGTMDNATFSVNKTTLGGGTGTGTASISGPTYNSTSGKFNLSSSGFGTKAVSSTVTVSAASSGYIAEGATAASETISSGDVTITVSGSKALDVIEGTTSATASIEQGNNAGGGLTKGSKGTSETWTDAAATTGATGTVPASGPYVKVSRSKFTNTVTATATPGAATITTEGYGTSAHNAISAGEATTASTTVTLNSGSLFVPVKEGSATLSITGDDISGTISAPTLNNSTGKYDLAVSGSTTVTASASVTKGWIESIDNATKTVSVGGAISLNKAALTHANTATATNPVVTVGNSVTKIKTSTSATAYYVDLTATPTAGSVTHSASVSEGYVPTAGLSQSATIATAATVSGTTGKTYFQATAITNNVTKGGATSVTGYNNPVTTDTASTTIPQVKVQGSATTDAVYNGTSSAKYINYYTGTYTLANA